MSLAHITLKVRIWIKRKRLKKSRRNRRGGKNDERNIK
jgi:hypothetical protein